MAVAFDTVTSTYGHGTTSKTVAVTVNTATNRCLVLAVGFESSNNTVSSVSGGGATWSKFNSFLTTGTPIAAMELWQGIGPSTGSQTITAVYTSSANKDQHLGIWSFNGVDQTTPLANYKSTNATAAQATITVTTASGDAAVAYITNTASISAPNTGNCNSTTAAGIEFNDNPFDNFWSATHCLAGGASLTLGFTAGSGDPIQGVAVKQVSAGGGTGFIPRLLTLGVGR